MPSPKNLKKVIPSAPPAQSAQLSQKAVDPTPTVSPAKEEMIMVTIDKDMTDGGLRVNGKLYVGNIRVPQSQATDLLRMQEEYFETKKKLFDKTVSVRMKSDFQKEKLFLADPKENAGKPGFTRDYGLLPQQEWSYCSDKFKQHLLDTRKQLYGY